MTEQLFARLVDNIGYGSEEELLVDLGQSDTTRTTSTSNRPDAESSTVISSYLEAKIEAARRAGRRHDYETALSAWDDVRKCALEEGDNAVAIKARLETTFLELQNGGDLDDVLSSLNQCTQEASNIDIGNDRFRLLQLLGEAHRLKGNIDQSRGFLTSALEQSRLTERELDEGWALLGLSALEITVNKDKETASAKVLKVIDDAYNRFSSAFSKGKVKEQQSAQQGFALCHCWRGKLIGSACVEDAVAEYSRALVIYQELGDEYEWDLADVLLERGKLQTFDDPQQASKDFYAAKDHFKRLGDRIGEAECFLAVAELLDHVGGRKESEGYYQEAARIAQSKKGSKRAAWFLYRYAAKLGELRKFEKSKSILLALLPLDELSSGQKLDILKILCLTAHADGQKDDLEAYSAEALTVIDGMVSNATSGDERRRLIISKGRFLQDLAQDEQAVACYRRGLKAFETANDRQGQIESWSAIAQMMGSMKNPIEERHAYEMALGLIGDNPDSVHLSMILTMLAQLDISEGKYDDARVCLDRAEHANERVRNPAVVLIASDLRSKLPSP